MINYETYCKIQDYSHNKHLRIRQIAKALGLDRKTVAYWLSQEHYHPRKTASRPSVLDPYKDQIIQWLESHPYSANQIFQKLKPLNYPGGYDTVKVFVRKVRPKRTPAYLSLMFAPGEAAQVDWGVWESVRVGSTHRRLSFFVMVLCYSRRLYVEFTLSQTMEHFLQCHQNALRYFGGTPKKIMVDNLRSAVLRRIVGQDPVFNPKYVAFAHHYGFKIVACGVGQAQEKGRVENAVGYVKKNLLNGLDIPHFPAITQAARQWMEEIANARIHGTTRKVPDEVFNTIEHKTLIPLPERVYDVATVHHVRANKQFRVHFESNRYSVPAALAGEQLVLKVYPDQLFFFHQDQPIAEHPRSFDRHQDFEHPDHVKALLDYRQKARDQKLLTRFFSLSPKSQQYYQQLEQRRLNTQHHVKQIVALTEIYPLEQVQRALEDTLELGVFSSEYWVNLLEQRQRFRPEPGALHLTRREDLLDIQLPAPNLHVYEHSPHHEKGKNHGPEKNNSKT